MQDFFEDHPNWGKVIISFIAMLLTSGIILPITIPQINNLEAALEAEQAARASAEAELATDIEQNAGNISDNHDYIVDVEGQVKTVGNNLTTHITAYNIFVEYVDVKFGEVWQWIDEFEVTWEAFVKKTNLRFESLNSAMAGWYNYLRTNCCSELEGGE